MVMTKLNRIDKLFARLKETNKKALMPYLMAGYPGIEMSGDLLVAVAEAGADLVEFGIPYSDPLADGPTIQAAADVALKNKVNTDIVFELVKKAREKTQIPIVLMTYYNTIYRYGLERFAKNAAECGADGVISPDLPPEEAAPWKAAADKYGLATVMLAAPTSTNERLKKVAGASQGFVYCVSLTGVTGARANLPANLADFIKRVRSVTDEPLAVGFGISRPEQARQISQSADGVIIGSALISLIEKSGKNCKEAAKSYISEIKGAMDS
jgi:tryptophan synthase alpha chain